MSQQDIENRVRTTLADVLALDALKIDASTSNETVQEWTSMNHLTVVMALEEEFGINFTDDETVTLTSYPAVLAAVVGKLA